MVWDLAPGRRAVEEPGVDDVAVNAGDAGLANLTRDLVETRERVLGGERRARRTKSPIVIDNDRLLASSSVTEDRSFPHTPSHRNGWNIPAHAPERQRTSGFPITPLLDNRVQQDAARLPETSPKETAASLGARGLALCTVVG